MKIVFMKRANNILLLTSIILFMLISSEVLGENKELHPSPEGMKLIGNFESKNRLHGIGDEECGLDTVVASVRDVAFEKGDTPDYSKIIMPSNFYHQGKIKFCYKFKNNTLQVEMLLEGNGELGSYYKSWLKSLSSIEQKGLLRKISGAEHPDIIIKKIDISDLEHPTVPFRAMIRFENNEIMKQISDVFQCVGGDSSVSLFCPELYSLPEPDTQNNDYHFLYPIKLVQEWICSPPSEDFELETLPKDKYVNTEIVSFFQKFAKDGEAIIIQVEFYLKKQKVEKDNYTQFYETIQNVLKEWKWDFTFIKQKIDKQERRLKAQLKKQPEDIKALLTLSKYYLSRGKYQKATTLLEKAVAIESEKGEIHYYLGVSLGYQDKYKKAKESFKKAKELGYRP